MKSLRSIVPLTEDVYTNRPRGLADPAALRTRQRVAQNRRNIDARNFFDANRDQGNDPDKKPFVPYKRRRGSMMTAIGLGRRYRDPNNVFDLWRSGRNRSPTWQSGQLRNRSPMNTDYGSRSHYGIHRDVLRKQSVNDWTFGHHTGSITASRNGAGRRAAHQQLNQQRPAQARTTGTIRVRRNPTIRKPFNNRFRFRF